MNGNPKLKGYFSGKLSLGIVLVVVGIPFLAAAGLGFLLILVGGYFIYSSLGGSDADVDAEMRRAIEWAKKRAHEKTDIDDQEEIAAPTEVLVGIHTRSIILDKNKRPIIPKIRKGKDGRPRFNPVQITVLIFGKDQIATYQTAVDLIGGGGYAEAMEEYFYNDVIGVKNDSGSWTYKDAKGQDVTQTIQNVSLVTNSGDRISVTIGIDNDSSDWSGFASGLDPQVSNIKKLLRERKSARLANP